MSKNKPSQAPTYKEELTTKMHAEFTVSDEVDQRNKIACIWCHGEISEAEARRRAESYGVPWEDACRLKESVMDFYLSSMG